MTAEMKKNLKNELFQNEFKNYKKVINKALEALGKKHLTIILHGASFPSIEGQNTGIGSPYSQGAKKFIDFIEGIFNSIQLGPSGKTKAIDASPYTGTMFSDNPLFIDLFELTTDKWKNILSEQTFQQIADNNPNNDKNFVAYDYIFTNQEKALREAFNNYKSKENELNSIKEKFESFIKKNIEWLEKDAVYAALTIEHGNDYWPVWKNKTDQNLYNYQNDKEKELYATRLQEIKEKYNQEIEYYYFVQFVANQQKQDIIKYTLEKDIKMIADRQVGFSDCDLWSTQKLFLQGWSLGCPPDYFSKDGQAWGFPVMDPENIFNEDGTLGEGGKLLKAMFKKIFKENPGGVRIDHIIGLVDPWVYKAGKKPKPEDGAGRLYSSPELDSLNKYARIEEKNLNKDVDSDNEKRVNKLSKKQVLKYAELLEQTVIQAAKEEGMNKNSIISEDLGSLTYPVEKVIKELKLSGVRVTQFVDPHNKKHPYRGKNIGANHWVMVGTHDNVPLAVWAESLKLDELTIHAKNLAQDLIKDKHHREKFAEKIIKDRKKFIKAKFAELFASPAENIQIFFSDFFGIKDVYNKPGTSGNKNWSLRVPNNFEDFYFEQLSSDQGINLPEVLKLSIESKGKKFVKDNKKLIEKLNRYASLLNE